MEEIINGNFLFDRLVCFVTVSRLYAFATSDFGN